MNITELCVKCNQNNSCTMCWKTSNKKCPHFIQKTNADRIRAMSDEELAKEFALIAGWDREQYEKAKRIGIEKVMLDWLRKEQGEHYEVD